MLIRLSVFFDAQKQVINYEYEINDYYGNEQSKKEEIDGKTAVGEYKTRMPDGQLQVVTYQSGPFGHLANVKYERGPDTVVYPTTTPVAPTTTTEYYAASTKAPVYGTTPKPVYSTVKPYVRTSSEVKYIKRARPSYRTYPVYPLPAYSQYVMRRPTDIQAPYQHNYQPTYQSSYPTIRYPEPTYKSPSLPPYAPLQSYLPNYPPSSYRSKY